MSDDPKKDHWLARPSTIRTLSIGALIVLALLVLADFVVHRHGHFAIEASTGFGAWYGFATCVAMVLFAKALGVLLKRPDRFYDD